MDTYLVTSVNAHVKSKQNEGEFFDIVEAFPVMLLGGKGCRAVVWFLEDGQSRLLFAEGSGCYDVHTLAVGRGTKPVETVYLGQPRWPNAVGGFQAVGS